MNKSIRNIVGVVFVAGAAALAADYGVAALLAPALAQADALELTREPQAEPCPAPARDPDTARADAAGGARAVADRPSPESTGQGAAAPQARLQWAVSCEPAAYCAPERGVLPARRAGARGGLHAYF